MRKKFFIKTLSLFLGLVFCLALFGCNNKNYISSSTFNTDFYLQVNKGTISLDTEKEILNFLNDLESELSTTLTTSKIYQFNNSTDGRIAFSNDAKQVFYKSKESYILTNGKFNPCLYPLSKIWQFLPSFPVKDFTPPSVEQLNAFDRSLLDFDCVSLNGNTIEKDKDIKLDFGGIAKGYAVQKIGEMLTQKGYKSGFLTLGSSSMYILSVQSLGVKHPEKIGQSILDINVKDKKNFSVASSGNYERYYTYDGNKYCHIIDGETLSPTQTNVVSATVLLKDGAVADALSTSLCLYPHSPNDIQSSPLVQFIKGLNNDGFIKNYGKLEFACFYNDGQFKQLLTNIDNSLLTINDTTYQIINI